MPQWLCNQLMRAFYNKNRRQIQLLNDSWFFYRTRLTSDESDMNPNPNSN
ncbi:cortex morphogenetic protein CmpA [Paenibacillus chartarius]|uniref:Cortex morphogenetic protein CmpA n=1 Tax=Paenibacillus chartarius TaxID=747481 RepID=A0ABV6DKT0_9BACL